MEIDRWNEEILNLSGIAAGLGSNDIGIDRGAGQGNKIVYFERVGPKIFMVQPNYRFRSSSSNCGYMSKTAPWNSASVPLL